METNKYIRNITLPLLVLLFLSNVQSQEYYPVKLVTTFPNRDHKETILFEYKEWPILLEKITTNLEGYGEFKGAETTFFYNSDHNLDRVIDKAMGKNLPDQEFRFTYQDRFLTQITRLENEKEERVVIFYSSPTTTYSFQEHNGNMWNYIFKKGDLVTVRNCGRELLSYYFQNQGGMDVSENGSRPNGPFKNLSQWPIAGYRMISSMLRSTRMTQMALTQELADFIRYDNSFIYFTYKLDEYGNPVQIEFRNAEDDFPFQTTTITYKIIDQSGGG